MNPSQFKFVLKQYRRDIPSVGTVDEATVTRYLAEGRMCRGWTEFGGKKQYFHIIKSPNAYPEKTVLYGDSEQELLEATVMMGMQNEVDLEDLFTE